MNLSNFKWYRKWKGGSWYKLDLYVSYDTYWKSNSGKWLYNRWMRANPTKFNTVYRWFDVYNDHPFQYGYIHGKTLKEEEHYT